MGKTEAKDLLEVTTRDGTRRDGHVSGRPCLGHPSSGQPALPEAVCVPVSIQGLEVLAIVDPLAAACTHGQLASCRGGKGVRNHSQEAQFAAGLHWPALTPHAPPQILLYTRSAQAEQ